jgi:hypothetical protein
MLARLGFTYFPGLVYLHAFGNAMRNVLLVVKIIDYLTVYQAVPEELGLAGGEFAVSVKPELRLTISGHR